MAELDSRNEPESPALPKDDGDDSGIDLDTSAPGIDYLTDDGDADGHSGTSSTISGSESEAESALMLPSVRYHGTLLANRQPFTDALQVTRKLRAVLDQLSRKQREVTRRDAELEGLRREIEQQRVELRGKEGQIARRDGQIGTLTDAVAQKDTELAQKDAELAQQDAEIAMLRQALEANKTPPLSPEADASGSASSGDTEAELKSLRKANRKLKAQISGQWKTIATLRAVVGDAERRYGLLYPIEKAKVILGAVYGRDLHNKPLVRHPSSHPSHLLPRLAS